MNPNQVPWFVEAIPINQEMNRRAEEGQAFANSPAVAPAIDAIVALKVRWAIDL
jgi:hypothetical protein